MIRSVVVMGWVLVMPLAAAAASAGAAGPDAVAAAAEPAPVPSGKPRRGGRGTWINLGVNLSSVSQSDHNCPGWQGGLTFARGVLVRLQYSYASFEDDDDTDTCDGLVVGDSDLSERSLLAGLALGRRGLFIAAGPSVLDVERDRFGPGFGPAGTDTGTRLELGYSAGLARGTGDGLELVLFMTDSEIRDLHGVALGLAFGLGR